MLNICVQLTSHSLFITVLLRFYQGFLNHIEYPDSLHVAQGKKILKVPRAKPLSEYGPPTVIYNGGGETHIIL